MAELYGNFMKIIGQFSVSQSYLPFDDPLTNGFLQLGHLIFFINLPIKKNQCFCIYKDFMILKNGLKNKILGA